MKHSRKKKHDLLYFHVVVIIKVHKAIWMIKPVFDLGEKMIKIRLQGRFCCWKQMIGKCKQQYQKI